MQLSGMLRREVDHHRPARRQVSFDPELRNDDTSDAILGIHPCKSNRIGFPAGTSIRDGSKPFELTVTAVAPSKCAWIARLFCSRWLHVQDEGKSNDLRISLHLQPQLVQPWAAEPGDGHDLRRAGPRLAAWVCSPDRKFVTFSSPCAWITSLPS